MHIRISVGRKGFLEFTVIASKTGEQTPVTDDNMIIFSFRLQYEIIRFKYPVISYFLYNKNTVRHGATLVSACLTLQTRCLASREISMYGQTNLVG